MTNIENSTANIQNTGQENDTNAKKQIPWAVIVIIVFVIAILSWTLVNDEEPVEQITEKIKPVVTPEPIVEELAVTESQDTVIVEPEVVEDVPVVEVKPPLPSLDESDAQVSSSLSQLTWRKELLKLVISDDMIRRFVVFTDNFSQGNLAYEHSPFISPPSSFSVLESKAEDQNKVNLSWNDNASRRFSLYVDLLRSLDVETLSSFYIEMKPLIDEAYAELGYPDTDFTEVLQSAITKVLDTEVPKASLELVQPSVMYRFKDPELEALDDAEKLLLRIGKENLLVIKSVLLEINEKLAK